MNKLLTLPLMHGTLINAAAVLAGSILGLLLHRKFPEKIREIAFQGIGLFTIFLGVSMALKGTQYLFIVISLLLGGIFGELLKLEERMNQFGEWLKLKLKSNNSKFTEGLITAFLLFCMGSMTILGAFEEGAGHPPNLLLAKSVMDGFSSLALAASLGVGVLFSVIPLLIYQGGLTVFAVSLQNVLSKAIILELTSVGGILLIGLGINILEIKKIKSLNLLPSFAVMLFLMVAFG